MTKQERKFSLAEVHTKMGTMGEITFDQRFMEILGIQPGDWIAFLIDEQGKITVKGEKKAASTKPAATPPGVAGIPPTEVTQPPLFDAGQPTPRPRQQRRTR
ncbi:MAG TPA: hypothetical protein VEP90_24785 [Methylomirabilota bacterium]|nr:hypothetical protein [Methylomirabilota bacterium]